MENQSRTQEILNKRNEILKSVKENLNYIYIVIMIIANALLSLLQIKNGEVAVEYPDSTLGWALWIMRLLITVFIGVMIMASFRQQGIKNGHAAIKDVYDEYLNEVSGKKKEIRARSLQEYFMTTAITDSANKSIIFIAVNILAVSLSIGFNLNSLLALIVNILMAVCFGIRTMLLAENYVCTELVVWYRIKINEMKKGEENKDEI